MKIVGIGGLPRSGKDTLAELLIKDGYFGFSFGDYNRKFTFERHKDKPDPISRENTTETSNWLREKYGADFFLKAALKEYEIAKAEDGNYKGVVLFSVRAPVEVDWILKHGGELIWVEASDKVRHQRMLDHLREGELPINLEEFKRQEAEQWQPQPGIPEESQMNISYVKKHATKIVVNNDNDVNKFLQAAQNALGLN